LFESLKTKTQGQVFVSSTNPGVTRGNHYHTKKIERFCVVSGSATIKLRKLFSKKVLVYKVTGKKPAYIDIPTFYTHNIKNTGKEKLLTIFWSNEIFDPKKPDTFMEEV